MSLPLQLSFWENGRALLGQYLDLIYVVTILICFVFIWFNHPKGPTGFSNLTVSFIAGAVAAYAFVLLIRGEQIDATILGLIVITAGVITLIKPTKRFLFKILLAVLAFLLVSAIVTIASENIGVGFLSQPIVIFWESIRSLFDSAVNGIFRSVMDE